jgi:hypothetical protein
MSVGFSNSWCRAGTVVFLWSVVTFGALQAADEPRPRGRPIEFSDLNGGASSTNTITLGSPSLRRPETPDRLTKPGSLDFRASPPVLLRPPPSGIIISRKRNNSSDDWASPEDAMNNYVLEEILGLPGYYSDDEQATAFFSKGNHGSLSRSRGRTNSPAGKGFSSSSRKGARDDQPDADAEAERASDRAILLDGTASPMKTLFNGGPDGFDSSTRRPEGFAELFGNNRRVDTTVDEMRDRKAREEQLDTFRKNLSFQPPAPAENFKPVEMTPTPGFAPVGGTFSPAPQTPFSPLPGAVNPAFFSGVPSAPTVPTTPTVPGLPGYSPPDFSAPSKLSRPEPVVVNPRRQF